MPTQQQTELGHVPGLLQTSYNMLTVGDCRQRRLGDWMQIIMLKKFYYDALALKESFVDMAMNALLNADERAEVNLKLCRFTCEVKRIDAIVHYLMFGGTIVPEDYPYSLTAYHRKQESEQIERRDKHIDLLEKQVEDLIRINQRLKHSIAGYKGMQNKNKML